jgi:hypothetical protein
VMTECRDCHTQGRKLHQGRCGACWIILDACARCGGDIRGHAARYDRGHYFLAQSQ